jgi:hypothetical protein
MLTWADVASTPVKPLDCTGERVPVSLRLAEDMDAIGAKKKRRCIKFGHILNHRPKEKEGEETERKAERKIRDRIGT